MEITHILNRHVNLPDFGETLGFVKVGVKI